MADAREEQGEGVVNPNSTISNAGHPLLNQVVASKIFAIVPLPELRTLRLVCKDWHSTSLPIWRRKVQINIHYWSPNQRLLQWESLGTELDVAGEKPFRNFLLHSPQFLPDISRQFFMVDFRKMSPPDLEGTYRNMERFWANYGHWIHKLELKDVFVTDVKAFKRAIFEQTPNLQELTLDVHDGRSGYEVSNLLPVQNMEDEGPAQPNLNLKVLKNLKDNYSCFPMLPFGWGLLFNRFPNIQKLEFADEPMEDYDKFVDCLEEMLRNPARCPNLPLTDLRLTNFKGNDVERILGMPLVKLKVFHLSIFYMKDDELDIFQTAMQFHGNTLKELHLENEDNSMDLWGHQVGPFPNLTELEMRGAAYALSFNFLNKLPNLKVLRVEQIDEDEMLNGTNWTDLEIMPHLREFYFIVTKSSLVSEDVLSEEDLERFMKVMPNLQCFTGQLTNLTLRVVCRNWRQMKKLAILSGQNFEGRRPPVGDIMDIDDVGITGIVRGSDERVPCVADLQELCHLTLEHVTLIGDTSVFEGFLKLPKLVSLDIWERNEILAGLEPLKRRLQGGLTITPLR